MRNENFVPTGVKPEHDLFLERVIRAIENDKIAAHYLIVLTLRAIRRQVRQWFLYNFGPKTKAHRDTVEALKRGDYVDLQDTGCSSVSQAF